MPQYIVRRATLADADALVQHRVRMFQDMGSIANPDARVPDLMTAYRAWLDDQMPRDAYLGWVVDAVDDDGTTAIVAGGGATIIPWPPNVNFEGARLAFVYNVYTQPDHRGRGLARLIMEAIHAFCREEGIGAVGLNASAFGQPLYESMGYKVTPSPMMFLSLD